MKSAWLWLGSVLASGLLAGLASAQCPGYCGCVYYPGRVHYIYPGPLPPRPPAPDMCGPGAYAADCCGAGGPVHCVWPPFPPYNGARPNPSGPAFGTHPFAHSPRDYFMLEN